jgi:hypothetical protein
MTGGEMTQPLSLKDQIKSLHIAGSSVREIAISVGATDRAVRGYLRRSGLKVLKAGEPAYRPVWPEQDIERMTAMFRRGLSLDVIASEMGRTRDSVRGKASNIGLYFSEQAVETDEQDCEISARNGIVSLPYLKFLEGTAISGYVMVKV